MSNVVAIPNEGDPPGVLLSSGCKAGPQSRITRGEKKKTTKQFEDIGMEIASFCY